MPTAVPLTGNPSIDGILWGWKWDSTHLTVSFPSQQQAAAAYQGYVAAENYTAFTQFQANQIVNFGLNNLGVFTDLSFSGDPNGTGNLRFAQATRIDYGQGHFTPGLHIPGGRGSAEANPPDPHLVPAHAQGDNWFTLGQYSNPVLGSFQYAAGLLHEVGHSLGLKHGHATQPWSQDQSVTMPALPADQNSQEFSVMTYSSHIGSSLASGASGQEEYPWTYMMNDVAALQHLYGANFGPGSNMGDNTYTFDPATGAMSVDGFSFGASYNAKILITIWDGGGTDTFNLSNYANDQSVDLRPGQFSAFSTAQLSQLNLGHSGPAEFARGNVANPYLYQGDLRSLIENVLTGTGNDVVTGNQVANVIRTGSGNDTLSGGAGDDRLSGEIGDDWITPGAGNDTVLGGSGSDMVSFVDLAQAVNASLRTLSASSGGDSYMLDGIENVTGSIFGDLIEGDGNSNRIRALGDYDWIVGSWGNDVIDGGNGRDMISYVSAPGAVTVDLGAGQGTRGQANGDRYVAVERVTGSSHADLFFGDAGQNDFRGLGGYDTFVGSSGGRERYDGGSGQDTVAYYLSGAGVVASLLRGYGSAGDAARDLYTSIENLGGTSLGDTLTGDHGRNQLRGLAGDDFIFGNGGVDYITGGRGDDMIDGGAGWDYAVYEGARADYSISTSGPTTTIRHNGGGADGTDRLTDVEVAIFSDGYFML
ncbi:M10 family metallopeptidase C-terminal domain-containing protein [Marinovum sp.]|uniref:M10 family metallopeptidase C-terminal domain-containing protein n=1 Tax=Marinovum sp. TaxID=2024839 RepID=UPI003A95D8B7